MQTPGDIAHSISDSLVEIAYWKQRRYQAANEVDRTEAGARILLWQGNLEAKRRILAEMTGGAVA